jgi:hypothetical protein
LTPDNGSSQVEKGKSVFDVPLLKTNMVAGLLLFEYMCRKWYEKRMRKKGISSCL